MKVHLNTVTNRYKTYKKSLLLESNIIKDIKTGNFMTPFMKFFISGLIMLYINILVLPKIIDIFDLELKKYMSLFIGINSIPLLFGTGSSIFMGSNFNHFKFNKLNLKRLLNTVLLGTFLISILLSGLLIFTGLLEFNFSTIGILIILTLQNCFTSLNLLLRTSGKIYITNIFSLLQLGFIYSTIVIPKNLILEVLAFDYLILILLCLWYFTNFIKNIDENFKENFKIFSQKFITKQVLILGLPTFLVQIFSLIAYIFIINFKNISPYNMEVENLAINNIINLIDKINIIIITIVQASGIIFTYNFYDFANKETKTVNKTLNFAILINILISIILSIYGYFELRNTSFESINLLDENKIYLYNFLTTSFIVGYPIFSTSLIIGGLYSSIKKIYKSVFYNILMMYLLFIPITFFAIWYNLNSLKLYSNILSYIILLIFLIFGYINLRKEIYNVKFKQNNG